MPTITELDHNLTKLREQFLKQWNGYETNEKGERNIPANDLEGLNKLQDDINEASKAYQALRAIETLAEDAKSGLVQSQTPVNRVAAPQAQKRIFDQLGGKLSKKTNADLDVDPLFWLNGAKATMTTGANGFPPEVLRSGDVVPAISRPPQLIDFLRVVQTNQNGIKFMRQSVRTNTAAAKSEASALDEATITYQEVTDIISRIGAWIPATEEQLEDEPMARMLVEEDLGLMTLQELDRLVTVGDGAAPNLRGIYNASSIQTQAKGADTTLDAIYKAHVNVRVVGRAVATLVALHSNDFQEIRLTKTTDGIYIYGAPTEAGPSQIFGMNVVLTEALTEGNGLVFDPSFFRIVMRRGLEIAVTDSHASNFVSNTLVLRAHIRAGLMRMRDQAACRVTGI